MMLSSRQPDFRAQKMRISPSDPFEQKPLGGGRAGEISGYPLSGMYEKYTDRLGLTRLAAKGPELLVSVINRETATPKEFQKKQAILFHLLEPLTVAERAKIILGAFQQADEGKVMELVRASWDMCWGPMDIAVKSFNAIVKSFNDGKKAVEIFSMHDSNQAVVVAILARGVKQGIEDASTLDMPQCGSWTADVITYAVFADQAGSKNMFRDYEVERELQSFLSGSAAKPTGPDQEKK